MKKNLALRIASGLMLSCLLTSCVISGTFAKYTTANTGSDSARVAKFGVEITANGNMFAESYDATDDAKTVISSEVDTNVIAPGTEGELTAMTISGKPEVSVNVSYDAELTLANWAVGGAYYCPITITVDSDPIYGMDYDSMADFEAAVEAAIEANTKDYTPNTEMSTASAPTVTWAWAFEGTDGKQTNEKDTALGDATTATIKLEITTTVSQIGD